MSSITIEFEGRSIAARRGESVAAALTADPNFPAAQLWKKSSVIAAKSPWPSHSSTRMCRLASSAWFAR